MLHASSFPKNLWAKCVKHAIWLRSRTSTKNLGGETPYEALTNQKLNLAELQEWGTKCWVHDNTRSKLDKRTCEGRWLGYDLSTNGSTAPKPKAYLLEEVSISHLKPPNCEIPNQLMPTKTKRPQLIQTTVLSAKRVRLVMAGGGELPRAMRTNTVTVAADVREGDFDEEHTLAAMMDLEKPVEPRTIQEVRELPECLLLENAKK
ncbi:hypothetical protein ACEPAG_5788 [Sanghuangporus baumii]